MAEAMGDKSGARLRAAAAEVVDAVVSSGRSLDAELAAAETRIPLEDRSLLRLLCFGALRYYWRLSAQVGSLLKRPLKKADNVISVLLAIGIYQLTDTRIPDYAAVSMTVDATKVLRRPKFAALVNAVLRNFSRRNIAEREPRSDEERFNHPQWMIDRIREDWPDHWREIFVANNERAPMWIRVNAKRSSADAWLGSHADVEASRLAGLSQALRLAAPIPAAELPGFAEGAVSIQDGAAQIAAPWLIGDGAADRVLDACAAPGGKTAHLLECATDVDLTALDVDADRLAVLEENLRRLELAATVRCGDASTPGDWWDGKSFQRILLDAPCSASGVIRRHPDIKFTRRASDLDDLNRRQGSILRALWPLLEANGRLLYVTCSVFRQENDAVVAQFLSEHEDARECEVLPNNNIRDLMYRTDCGYQILPGREGLDGFYFACLQKQDASAA